MFGTEAGGVPGQRVSGEEKVCDVSGGKQVDSAGLAVPE
jgi:hypothetical protein